MVAVGRIACTHCQGRSQSCYVVIVVPPRDSASYNQLWQDVDLAVAIFLAATRGAATWIAFDVFAALRDALCRGIVNRLPRCPAMGPRSPMRPMLQHRAPARCSPRTPVLVRRGTLTRRPAPPGDPSMLCALGP